MLRITPQERKELEFVIEILKVAEKYENNDFNIINTLQRLIPILRRAENKNASIREIIDTNEKYWRINNDSKNQ